MSACQTCEHVIYVLMSDVSDDHIIEVKQYAYNVKKEPKLTQHDFPTTPGMRLGPNLEMTRTTGHWFNLEA